MTEKQTEKADKKKTRFSGIAARGKLPVEEPQIEPEVEPEATPAHAAAVAIPAPPVAAATKVRQPGKKDNPAYVQVTVYLRKDIYKTARKLLIDDGRQVSELVDDLVSGWITTRPPS
jgi:hypothetical protein